MVIDVPSPEDFRSYGLRYVNLGWGMALEVILDYSNAKNWGFDFEPEVEEGFWKSAEPEFSTALTLIEQGIEFLIKEKIAEISPWLLLSHGPDRWPKRSDKEDVAFSSFRTLDAQDLLKVHDTFAKDRLSVEFAQAFDELRRKRNAMMHTVDLKLKATASEIIRNVLLSVDNLLGEKQWPAARHSFLEQSRDSQIEWEMAHYQLAREFSAAIALLEPAELRRFFGFEKRQRAYSCPECSTAMKHAHFACNTAQLRPNNPTSTKVFCFVCRAEYEVERRPCELPKCKGNVIYSDQDYCLTCHFE